MNESEGSKGIEQVADVSPSSSNELSVEEESLVVGRGSSKGGHGLIKITKQGVGREASSAQICGADRASPAGPTSTPAFF